MSAANAPISSSSLDAERRAHEPSMEEILASIRRIIADDDGAPQADARPDAESAPLVAPQRPAATDWPAPRSRAPLPLEPAPPVLRASAAPSAPSYFDEPEPLRIEPIVEAPRAFARDEAPAVELYVEREDEAVFVRETTYFEDEPTAAHELDDPLDEPSDGDEPQDDYEEPSYEPVDALSAPLVSSDAAAAVAAQFQTLAASMVINDSGLLHRYAQEMLRPMLKQWLDDNLPVIVERLVRSEIERVARGGRR